MIFYRPLMYTLHKITFTRVLPSAYIELSIGIYLHNLTWRSNHLQLYNNFQLMSKKHSHNGGTYTVNYR